MLDVYSKDSEMNLDLRILKMRAEYSVLPSSKRVGKQIEKITSSREGSVTQDTMKSSSGRRYLENSHAQHYPVNLGINKNWWVLVTI